MIYCRVDTFSLAAKMEDHNICDHLGWSSTLSPFINTSSGGNSVPGGPTFSCDFQKGNSWILSSVNATQEVIFQMTVKVLLLCYNILIMYLSSKENNTYKFWHFNSPETVQKCGYNKVWKTIWLSASFFVKPAHAYFTLFLLIWYTRKQVKLMSCWTKCHN